MSRRRWSRMSELPWKDGGGPVAWRSIRVVDQLLGIYLCLVLWNGLISFQVQFAPVGASGDARVLGLPVSSTSYPDIISNIVLYVPLGALISLHFGLRNRRLMVGPVLALGASAALSYGIEFLQLFAATRVSSVQDLVCNVVGAGVGSVCAPVLFAVVRLARRRWGWELRFSPLASLTKMYGVVLLIIALVPWTFTLDRSLITGHYRAASVRTIEVVKSLVPRPAYDTADDYRRAAERRRLAMETVMTGIYELTTFAVLAALVSRILACDFGFRPASRILLTLWVVGGFATALTLLQLLVRFGTGNFLLYVCRLYGTCAGIIMFRLVPEHWIRRDVIKRWYRAGFPVSNRTRLPLIPCAVFIVLFMSWVPFFITMSGRGPEPVNAPMLMPFYGYFSAKVPVALQDFFSKLIRFGALGFALSLMAGPPSARMLARGVLTAGFWCVVLSGVIEVVQIFIPTRNPDVTDLLVAFLGGVGGAAAYAWLLAYLRWLGRDPVSRGRSLSEPAPPAVYGCEASFGGAG